MAENNAQDTNAQGAAAGEQPQLQFGLQSIYVKDISFESPNAPQVFQEAFKPKVNVDLGTSSTKIGEDLFEVVVKITARVNHSETDNTCFLAEIEQAGLFRITGLEGERLDHTLGAFCPSMLFPYARECIDNLVNRGSFPPLMLAPVNFDAMYLQNKQRKEQADTQDGDTPLQ